MAQIFIETDPDRLHRRLTRLAADDLTSAQIRRLADGDLAIIEQLPAATQLSVLALLRPDAKVLGRAEKMVGVSLDFVPVAYLDLARMASKAVARVVGMSRQAIGTGMMVSPRLFLTNNHVTDSPAAAAEQILQFDYELGVDRVPLKPTEFTLDPNAFFWTSPLKELDATLVAVGRRVSGTRSLGDAWVPLSGASDKHAEGDFVTIIQHPDGDYTQIALRENRVIGRGKGKTTLHYGADTLPGSSGSPVFNDQFELVALHHAGGPLNEQKLDNGKKVPDDSNEGIRMSKIVEALRSVLDGLSERRRGLLAAALDPPSKGPRVEAGPALAAGHAAAFAGGPVEVTLPLRLTAGGVPAMSVAGAATPAEVAAPGLEAAPAPDPRYGARRGYNDGFLPQPVGLPGLSKTQKKAAAVPFGETVEDGLELQYHHFSVVQNGKRKMPFFTAVNIDGARARSINRKTGDGEAALDAIEALEALEASERWFLDPRIADAEQLTQPVFDKQQPRIFDRGHLVRRLDPAWGSAETAVRAAADTFHFTNCSLQVAQFNQGKRLWAGIEDFVLNNAKVERQRVTVFTGPVFGKSDPAYRGVEVPKAFWKVLVRVEDDRLRATGFVADQSDLLATRLERAEGAEGEEGFDDLGEVAVFQRPITEIARLTGLTFDKQVVDADTAAPAGPEALRTPLARLEDASW